MDVLIHPATMTRVDAYLDNPAHALLIEGVTGSGKGVLAEIVASRLLGIPQGKLAVYPYHVRITPIDKSISISVVRELQQFMRLKTLGTDVIRRIVIIEDADSMTIEAQNAFLKLLEEPPADTVLILTSTPNSRLLPTIYSRVQTVRVINPSKEDLLAYFEKTGHNTAEVEKAYYISEGSVGLMSTLLQSDSDSGIAAQIGFAKEIMRESVHDRLARVDVLSKDKESLPDLLFALQRVVHAVLVQACERGNNTQVTRVYSSLKRIIEAQSMLVAKPNTKLLLTDLFLNI